jgi:anti-sigma regulatory factor (Ser/Thr protein kinase)
VPDAELELEEDLAILPAVRDFIRDRLRGWGAEGLAGPVVLLATELVSNAVRHGCGPICLHLSVDSGRARVVVSDGSPAPPVLKEPSALDTGGRGLRWVSQFSSAWGHEVSPGGGKAVWFEIDPRVGDRER